jgi:F-box/WD-40 domain protein MET30
LADELQDLQILPQSDQQGISQFWALFSAAPSKHRKLMLQGLLSQCCFPQLSFLLTSVRDLIKIDFLAALPTELGFQILRNLDTASLCKATQVSRRWRAMADDDVVWHRMCEQHIARKCTKCGWGLPLLERKRLMASKHNFQLSALGKDAEAIPEKRKIEDPEPFDGTVQLPQIRPWKDVYRDRFLIGSNWKHGRYTAKTFRGHTNGVMCLQFNDHVLATGSYDSTIKIWDVDTEQEIRTLRGHSRGVRALQFDDTKLISGSLDHTIKVWNWRTGDCLRTLTGHTGGVLSLNFCGRILASGSVDGTIRIWDFEGGSTSCLRGHQDWVNCVKVDGPSRTLLSASDDGTARLWDLDTGNSLRTYEGHAAQVQAVLPLPEDFECEESDSETAPSGEEPGASPANSTGGEDEPQSSRFVVAFSKTGRTSPPRYMLTASLDNTIRLWDVHTGRCLRVSFGHVEGVWAISADAMRIVSGAQDSLVKVWDTRSGQCERSIVCHRGPVTFLGMNDSRKASGG